MDVALLKNASWGAPGKFAVRGTKIVQVILIARLLGAEDLGRYSYGVALVGVFSLLFDFGVLPVAVKTLYRQLGRSAVRLFARLKLITSLLGLCMLGVVAMLSKASETDTWQGS